jgi:xanthine dehydrogenase accessory factor
MARDIYEVVQELRATRRPFAVATVVETRGSVSAKTSAKAVIDEQGRVVAGWVGGGCAESAACHAALETIRSGESTILEVDMDDEVLGAGMPCGGHMRVYVEPVLPRPTLWLMGHGRVAECLCVMADLLGIEIVVIDALANPERYPAARQLVTDDDDYSSLTPVSGDFVVVATQHKGDHLSMKRALVSEAGYIALIASRKRARLVLDYLRRNGIEEREVGRVMAPAGLDLGARTPEEIALCVMAEIVLVRRGGSGVRMRDKINEPAGKPRLASAGG